MEVHEIPILEKQCEHCDGEGVEPYVGGRCYCCNGSGFETTEFGDRVLRLMKHNLKPMLEECHR